jgi:hypothetical protein
MGRGYPRAMRAGRQFKPKSDAGPRLQVQAPGRRASSTSHFGLSSFGVVESSLPLVWVPRKYEDALISDVSTPLGSL